MSNPKASTFRGTFADGPAGQKFSVFWDDEDNSQWGSGPRNFDEAGQPVKPGWYWAVLRTDGLYAHEPKGPYPDSEGAYLAAIGE